MHIVVFKLDVKTLLFSSNIRGYQSFNGRKSHLSIAGLFCPKSTTRNIILVLTSSTIDKKLKNFEFIFEFKIAINFEFNFEIFVNVEFNFEIFVNCKFIFEFFLSILSLFSRFFVNFTFEFFVYFEFFVSCR